MSGDDPMRDTLQTPGRETWEVPSTHMTGVDLPRLPPGAPAWMARARQLSYTLEWAIRTGTPPTEMLAGVERAWEAWVAGGFSYADIARVVHVVDRAWQAIRSTPPTERQGAYVLCAEVMQRTLPSALRRSSSVPDLVRLVRELGDEPMERAARRHGAMVLLGWRETSERAADSILEMALAQ